MQQRWKDLDGKRDGKSPTVTTPPTRVATQPVSGDNASGPKPDRSKIRQRRSPSIHYSPRKGVLKPSSTARATAVKVKAAPKPGLRVSISQKPREIPPERKPAAPVTPKAETPDAETTKAIQQALQRQSTADMHKASPPSAAVATTKSTSDSEDDRHDMNDDDKDIDNHRLDEEDAELSLAAVRARNAARARWMRFSRSLKFKSIMPE